MLNKYNSPHLKLDVVLKAIDDEMAIYPMKCSTKLKK